MHELTIRSIEKYFVSTSTYTILIDGNIRLSTHGIVYRTYKEKCIDFYVDAEFSGSWYQVDADNAENSMSCTGYVQYYGTVSYRNKLLSVQHKRNISHLSRQCAT